MLVPLALIRCGGSDNSDIGADAGRLREAGLGGGGSGDASDARVDVSGPTPGCPPVEPIPGLKCPAPMLVCTYGDRICVCSTTMGVSWVCIDPNDASTTPDGGRGGTGGTGGSGGSSVDGGGDVNRPPDGGRADTGSTDAGGDTGRDAGRGGGGAGGTGGRGSGGTGGRSGGRDGGASVGRDGATDGTADATGADRANTDATVDDGGVDDAISEDVTSEGGTSDEGGDSGDDGD